ncbi:P-loop NTPase family protein [Burkholderia multivorans]|uniref:hypothetical protein n=1 Tax=Burkholderia multivorans TaxID=87883 RepID=UPI0009B92D92|nr:hypothetical protein [Burkholderia multivorans]MDR9230063.1 hypothetical protein [Burkholderia multivorans]HDR9474430.1 hypothetical protein [Burkholderia multivorans]HDR9480272.1 hypothetical protein [Burkholderia multivorans]
MSKKIAVINLSGNVGKTTLATNWLKASRPEATFISVELHNASVATEIESTKAEEFSASEFRDIFRSIMMKDDVIVDVGASNVVQFMTELTRYKSAIGELDLIIVPTVPADKQQKDTIATIEWLSKLGFPANKIRIVFNMYNGGEANLPVEYVYSQIAGYAATEGKNKATYEPHIVIKQSEVFDLVRRKNIRELAEDQTDWRAKRAEAKAAGDMEALEAAIDAQADHDLAVDAQANLARATDLLFGKAKTK